MSAAAPAGVAVVSGAGTGLGRGIAIALAAEGYRLALIGRRSTALMETLALAGVRRAEAGLAYPCDVRSWSAVADVARRVPAELGPADILVPAAGLARLGPLADQSSSDFAAVVETNLIGSFHLIRAFLPQLRERPRSWIFPLLSVAARRGFPDWGAYCASKWGLAGLVAVLREEVRGTPIRVTALYPGATDTPLWNDLPGEWNRSAMLVPDEVASALRWALSLGEGAVAEEIHLGPAAGPQ